MRPSSAAFPQEGGKTNYGPGCAEIRWNLHGDHRKNSQCRPSCGQDLRRRKRRHGHRVCHGRGDQQAGCPGQRNVRVSQRAGVRRPRRLRGAGLHRPAVDVPAVDGLQGQKLPRPPDSDSDRQRLFQGAHRKDRGQEDPRGPEKRDHRRRRRLPGHGPGREHHHPGPRRLRYLGGCGCGSAQGRRLRDLHRRRRGLHHRPAHRPRGLQDGEDLLRRDAGDGLPRLQGAADPLGGVRQEIRRGGPCPFKFQRQSRDPGDEGGCRYGSRSGFGDYLQQG